MTDKSLKLKASSIAFSRLMTAEQSLKDAESEMLKKYDDDDFFGSPEHRYEVAKRNYEAWSYILKLIEQDI